MVKNGGFISSFVPEKNTMISSPLKSHTSAHTVCGRHTLKVFARFFFKGSLRRLYERSIYERIFLSEPIENHAISNELFNVKHVKKHLHKHYRVFRRNREPSRNTNTNSGGFEEQEQKG